jgi:hypothetical protein
MSYFMFLLPLPRYAYAPTGLSEGPFFLYWPGAKAIGAALWERTEKGQYQISNFKYQAAIAIELELELIQSQMTQKPMLREEVGMRVRCANNSSAE